MKLRSSILYSVAALAFALSLAACKSSTSVSNAWTPPAHAITKDTVGGYQGISGVMLADSTYYMDSTIIIPAGDTLIIQHGVHVIVLNTGTTSAVGSPEFQVFGTLICDGQQGDPIYLTVPKNLRKYADLTNTSSNALWGGIECAGPTTAGVTNGGSGDLILKWTHIEFAGGSSGTNDPIVGNGGTRYAVWFQNPNANFIMEDSWITGSTDDPLRVSSGKISIFRNVVECAAPTSGDFNMKSGTVGDIAYNVFIGIATNGPKLANTGGSNPECNVNIYNNTIVTGGWRCTKSGRAGSTDIEAGARGTEYNNMIVNCRTGFRLLTGGANLADTANTAYGYQYYYGSEDSVVAHFNSPSDGGIQVWKTGDVHGTAGQNNPMFVGYNPDQFPVTYYNKFPMAFSDQLSYPAFNLMRSMDEKGNQRFVDVTTSFKSDFHLQPSSPAVGHAYTGTVKTNSGQTIQVPMNAVTSVKSASNPYGADYTTLGLGKDYGAYQQDGSGNQQ